jgi:hypothetical protein
MKLKVLSTTQTLIVMVDLHLKRTITTIECKLYLPSGQLNLKEIKNSFLVKDKHERTKCEHLFLTHTRYIVKMLARGKLKNHIKEDHTCVVWYT